MFGILINKTTNTHKQQINETTNTYIQQINKITNTYKQQINKSYKQPNVNSVVKILHSGTQ